MKLVLYVLVSTSIFTACAQKKGGTQSENPQPSGIQTMSQHLYYTSDSYKQAKVTYNGVSSFFIGVADKDSHGAYTWGRRDFTFECDMSSLKCIDDSNNKATVSSDGSQFSINSDIFYKL
jgi:hypothetical protein